MIVNLIKPEQMFSLTLPNKVKGRYWLTDIDAGGERRELISVEAIRGEWVLKSNRKVTILDAENKAVSDTVLKALSFFHLKIRGSNDRVILFAENIDESRQTMNKLLIKEPAALSIGRSDDNEFCYDNKFVSGSHARLSYDGHGWFIMDTGSTNGTYVNGRRFTSGVLKPGDFIYIIKMS